MKIYISLPITGQDIEAVEASVIFAKAVIEKKGHTPVSPLDQDTMQDYATLMGTILGRCFNAMRSYSLIDGKRVKVVSLKIPQHRYMVRCGFIASIRYSKITNFGIF